MVEGMIERVSIRNFRSVASLDLELGAVNVFIGANGSGKSNILEAIGLVGAAAAGQADDAGMLRRGMRPGEGPALLSGFGEDWRERELRVRVGNKNFGCEVDFIGSLGNPDIEASLKTGSFTWLRGFTRDSISEHVELNDNELKSISILKNYAIFTPQTPILRGLAPDPQQMAPLGLSGGRLADAVRDTFRQRTRFVRSVKEDVLELIGWADSFKVVPVSSAILSSAVPSLPNVIEFTDRFMATKKNRLSAYDVSEGALFVLFAAVLCAHPKAPPMFAIDNADHGLNPRLARALVTRFCRWITGSPAPRQALLTTHNPAVLDGLPLQDDRVRLFAVDRDSAGRTVATRVKVDEAMLARAREGWTLSRMWVSGMIGGVPDV